MVSWNNNQLRYHHCSVILWVDFAAFLWGYEYCVESIHVCMHIYVLVCTCIHTCTYCVCNCGELVFNYIGSFCHWTIRVWWMLSQRDLSKSLPTFLSNFMHIVTSPLCCQCQLLPRALRREMKASTVRSLMVWAQLVQPANLGGLGAGSTECFSAPFAGAFCRFGFPQAPPQCHGPAKQRFSCSGPKLAM